ncbi:MAG: RICIN domain-containing protein [Solitalea-like symbiont of Acarus siro]
MKKLLFATLVVSISLLSFKKETDSDPKNYSESPADQTRGSANYGYAVYSWELLSVYAGYIVAEENSNLANVFVTLSEDKLKKNNFWYIEESGGYTKFWWQNRGIVGGIFQKWRLLDVDWRNPQNDGALNVVLYVPNGDDNQEWKVIGNGKKFTSNLGKAFVGVIVNKRDGRMLEFRNPSYRYFNAVLGAPYKGSIEEAIFQRDGNFLSLKDKKRLWIIYKPDSDLID